MANKSGPKFLSYLFCGSLLAFGSTASQSTQPVYDLITRVTGLESTANRFQLQLVPTDEHNREMMGLSSNGNKIVLQGSSLISLASAFNWYLNDYLNTTYDWSTYEVFIPANLPLPTTQQMPRLAKYSYHLNVCTYGYSLAFVDWAYWQKHIDWMAMQGINLPLAFLGQEKVLQLTFSHFNITFEELQEFATGPAFLPWFRMGNVQAWGGPLSESWIDKRVELQKLVLARMRSLGMRPVLPAFAGFVPPAFGKKFPKANVTTASNWNGFADPYGDVKMLEATDPLFNDIGQTWIQEQTQLYGTDHIYQCDTFNEMQPRSGDHDYLGASSKAVLSAMQAADPDAVWLMQGWLFYSTPQGFWSLDRVAAYLNAVPNDRMMILDLAAGDNPVWKKTNSFFGKPFIWNSLYNYGQQSGLVGNLPQISNGVKDALPVTNTQGVGITMEGIWTNYIVYEFTLYHAWGRAGDPVAYAERFGSRRYGPKASDAGSKVWSKLYNLAYTSGSGTGPRSGTFTNRPRLPPKSEIKEVTSISPKFGEVWSDLLALAPEVSQVQAFRFDLVDVGREVLTEVFDDSFSNFVQAVYSKNMTLVSLLAEHLLEVLDDIDRLLSSDSNFMLGRWLSWASGWSDGSAASQALLDFNARNQITIWGPRGEIIDYATKAWGGLTRAYFKPRWSLFFSTILASMSSGIAFNQTAFNQECLKSCELPWQTATDKFPVSPEEDAILVAKALYVKYVAPGTFNDGRHQFKIRSQMQPDSIAFI